MDKYYLKDLKKAYRILRKEKNEYPKGDEKRIELNKKMKEIKLKIEKESGDKVEIDPQKQDIINKIIEFKTKSRMGPMSVETMSKFTYNQLEFHYMKITGQVLTKDEYNKLKGIIDTPAPAPVSSDPSIPETAVHSPIEAGIRRIKRKDPF